MSVQIPTSQVIPFYTESLSLDGQTFNLQFKWNDRDSAWYMDLLTDTQDVILYGIKIVVDWPLLYRYAHTLKPKGEIVAVDTTGSGLDPAFDELGTRVLLVYITEAELNA